MVFCAAYLALVLIADLAQIISNPRLRQRGTDPPIPICHTWAPRSMRSLWLQYWLTCPLPFPMSMLQERNRAY